MRWWGGIGMLSLQALGGSKRQPEPLQAGEQYHPRQDRSNECSTLMRVCMDGSFRPSGTVWLKHDRGVNYFR